MSAISSDRSVCARIAQRLADHVGQKRYDMWFDRTARFEFDDVNRRLDVAVPNKFVAEWIGRHFEADLRLVASHELGDPIQLSVLVNADLFTAASAAPTAERAVTGETAEPARRPVRHTGPRSQPAPPSLKHKLDDFIIGSSNELAFAAATRIADDDHAAGTPLFIHGGCGMGKTHLLQGVCRRLLDRNPDARVLYTTGEEFTNEFLTAVRNNKLDAFRKRIRHLDLLAVDDVHFLANKEKTQQEFLHSFDAIDLGGARVVLASDSHPRLINQFSEALVSRCVRGLVVEVKPPDTATRLRIVRALAEKRGIPLMDTVVEVIASKCLGSVRDLEGTLTKLQALATLTGQSADGTARPIGHTLVNHLFDAQQLGTPRRAVRIDEIINAVAEELGVSRQQINASGRHARVVLARAVVIHLTRLMTPMSYPEIAAAMGRKNHSTIITAAQRIQKQIEAGERFTQTGSLEETPLTELIERLRQRVLRG